MRVERVRAVRTGHRQERLLSSVSSFLSRGIASIAVLSAVAPAIGAQAPAARPAPPPPIAAPSAFASVEVHINARAIGGQWFVVDAGLSGPSRIAITYGQPAARGRKIEGGLIPVDTVWRFGANTAATLHTDVDLMLGTLRVPKGDYSLFLLNGSNGWQLIVNRQTGQWGTDYDPARDLGRLTLSRRALTEPMESFVVFMVPNWTPGGGDGNTTLAGKMTIMWGSSALSTDWSVPAPTK